MLFLKAYNKYMYLMKLESSIINYLVENKITVGTAESCTGGLLAAAFTSYPGVSTIYQNGMITYSDDAKSKFLKVSPETLRRNGAVSRQVCAQMCFNLAKISKCQLTLSTTGVAGPGGGTKTKPVGLVYIGIKKSNKLLITKNIFKQKKRGAIQKATVKRAIYLINSFI